MMNAPTMVTIVRIHLTDTHMFSLVATLESYGECYRFIKNSINYDTDGNITVSYIDYETTFTDKEKAHLFFNAQLVEVTRLKN